MLFLTYNDAPTGIYYSQVLDVCRVLQKYSEKTIEVVSIFPSGLWAGYKHGLEEDQQPVYALPALYPLRLYWLHAWKYKKFFRNLDKKNVIARGPFACALALKLKRKGVFKKVIYDGRGAVKAEFEEYMAPGTALSRLAARLEKRCVLEADFRIAVSTHLVSYWKKEFGYTSSDHVVIPTTLSSDLTRPGFETDKAGERRKQLKFKDSDVIFVYSGGVAEWQSFHLIRDFVEKLFPLNENYKLLCLMPPELEKDLGLSEFAGRVIYYSYPPGKGMLEALSVCDYGLLLRENTVTNQVSSPTKFAEYLAAGLEVIITENVGDCSGFVKEHKCGRFFNEAMDKNFGRVEIERKKAISDLAFNHLSKNGVLSARFSFLGSVLSSETNPSID